MAKLRIRAEETPTATEASSPKVAWVRVEGLTPPRVPGRKTRDHLGAGEGIRTLDPNLGKVEAYVHFSSRLSEECSILNILDKGRPLASAFVR